MRRFERAAEAQGFRAVVEVDAGKFEHALVVRVRGQADAKPFRFRTTRAGFVAAADHIRQTAGGAWPAVTPSFGIS